MKVNLETVVLSPDGETPLKDRATNQEIKYGNVIFGALTNDNSGNADVKYRRGALMAKIVRAEGDINLTAEEILLIVKSLDTEFTSSWVTYQVKNFVGEADLDGLQT